MQVFLGDFSLSEPLLITAQIKKHNIIKLQEEILIRVAMFLTVNSTAQIQLSTF
jgi:hypothetical protein